MEIQHYLEILGRQKWVVISTTLITVLIVTLGSFLVAPTYAASTTVRIAQEPNPDGRFNLDYSERLINTYVHVLESRPFLEDVINRLELNTTPKALARKIKVEALANTELIKISARSQVPQQAMEIANTLGALLIAQRQAIYSGQTRAASDILQEQLTIIEKNLSQDRQLLEQLLNNTNTPNESAAVQTVRNRIEIQEQTYAFLLDQYDTARTTEAIRANSASVVEPATLPDTPVSPRKTLNIALGVLIGLIGGTGLAFLFENLDPTVHSVDDLEAIAGVPIVGQIPKFVARKRLTTGVRLHDARGVSPASEAFRILRTNIVPVTSRQPLRTLLVASAEPGAGRSTVLANLAAAMAQAGRHVVVVDTDLRHPTLHRIFNVPNETGLSSALLGLVTPNEALQDTRIAGIHVLTSGPLLPKPEEQIESPGTPELIHELANNADIVLFDSPPILAAADAAVLAPLMDGVLLVAAQGEATGRHVQRTLQQLKSVGAHVLGIVFNKATADLGTFGHHRDNIDPATSATNVPLVFG